MTRVVGDSEQAVDDFRQLAAAYCELIEGVEGHEADEVTRRLATLLPGLMGAAERLPRLEPVGEVDAPEISHKNWSARYASINALLGSRGEYWTTMDVQAAEEPEVVNLPIADDLADIWRDLRGGLDLEAIGGDIADVVWEWRFNYETHWGSHAVEALRAVHAVLR